MHVIQYLGDVTLLDTQSNDLWYRDAGVMMTYSVVWCRYVTFYSMYVILLLLSHIYVATFYIYIYLL